MYYLTAIKETVKQSAPYIWFTRVLPFLAKHLILINATLSNNAQVKNYQAILKGNNPLPIERMGLQILASAGASFIFLRALGVITDFYKIKVPAFLSLISNALGMAFALLPIVVNIDEYTQYIYNRFGINKHKHEKVNGPLLPVPPHKYQKAIDFINKHFVHVFTIANLTMIAACLWVGQFWVAGLMAATIGFGFLERYRVINNGYSDKIFDYISTALDIAFLFTGSFVIKLLSAANLFSKLSLKIFSNVFTFVISYLPIPIPALNRYRRAYQLGAKVHQTQDFSLVALDPAKKIKTHEEFDNFLTQLEQLPLRKEANVIKPNRAFVQNTKASDLLPTDNKNIDVEIISQFFNELIYQPYLQFLDQNAFDIKRTPAKFAAFENKLNGDFQARSVELYFGSPRINLLGKVLDFVFNKPEEEQIRFLNLFTERNPNNPSPFDTKAYWINQINLIDEPQLKQHLLEYMAPKMDGIEYVHERIATMIDTIKNNKFDTLTKEQALQAHLRLKAITRALVELKNDIQNEQAQVELLDLITALGIEAGKYCDTGITAAIDRCYQSCHQHLPKDALTFDKKIALVLNPTRERFFTGYFLRKFELLRDPKNFRLPWKWLDNNPQIPNFLLTIINKFVHVEQLSKAKTFHDYFPFNIPTAYQQSIAGGEDQIIALMTDLMLTDIHVRNDHAVNFAPRLFADFSIETDAAVNLDPFSRIHNSAVSQLPDYPSWAFPSITQQNVEYHYWKDVSTKTLIDEIKEKFDSKELSINEFLTPWLTALIQKSDLFENKEELIESLADFDTFEKLVNYQPGQNPKIQRGLLILLALDTGVVYIDEKINKLAYDVHENTFRFPKAEKEMKLDDYLNINDDLSYRLFNAVIKSAKKIGLLILKPLEYVGITYFSNKKDVVINAKAIKENPGNNGDIIININPEKAAPVLPGFAKQNAQVQGNEPEAGPKPQIKVQKPHVIPVPV